jgi:RNA polymerase sigma-70 factor (ECF subfamily)
VATASDATFWQTTYREHGSSVLAFLASRVGRRDLAEDLLQETFLRAMRRRPDLTDAGKMRSYLISTAFNLVVDQSRRRRPVLFSETTGADGAPVEPADESSASVETLVDLRRLESQLDGVLKSLRPALRTAFAEAVLGQKPYSEIAREHGWSLQQVRVNVYRARKEVIARMRHLLSPIPEFRR